MWRRRSRGGAAPTAAPPRVNATPQDVTGSLEVLRAEIASLTEANRRASDPELERRLVGLRHLAGLRLIDAAPAAPRFVEPDVAGLGAPDPLPEVAAPDLTAGLLRAGILRDGCLLVRGLVAHDAALALGAGIDRAFDERGRQDGGAPGHYEEFRPHARYGDVQGRSWIKQGGGLLAADSPMLHFQMMELFEGAGLPRLVADYLGEPALISVHKTTLRKADPAVPGAWHQDGFFMGQDRVRSLNLWLSLSRCGDMAPGLDIVPRRLDRYVATATDEAALDYTISARVVRETAGDTPVIRPIFEPGDAIFFDELFLHQTGSEPTMPNPRYAVENWFFGATGFPEEYAPVAV